MADEIMMPDLGGRDRWQQAANREYRIPSTKAPIWMQAALFDLACFGGVIAGDYLSPRAIAFASVRLPAGLFVTRLLSGVAGLWNGRDCFVRLGSQGIQSGLCYAFERNCHLGGAELDGLLGHSKYDAALLVLC